MPANTSAENTLAKEDLKVTWHAISREKVLQQLDSGIDNGLTSSQAESRLEKFGPNQLKEGEKTTFWQMIFEQLIHITAD